MSLQRFLRPPPLAPRIAAVAALVAGAVTLTAAPDAAAQTGEHDREISYPETGVELGRGWVSREIRPGNAICVAFKAIPIQEGEEKQVSVSRVSDNSSLSTHIGLSAEERVKGIGDMPNVGGKFGFAANLKFDQKSSRWSVRARVAAGSVEAGVGPGQESLTLTQEARTILQTQGKDAFFRHCGDSYVSAIEKGAELVAVITTTLRDVDGDYAVSSETDFTSTNVEFGEKFEEKVSAHYQQSSFSAQIYETGGSGSDPPPDCSGQSDETMCELKAKVEALSDRAAQAPYSYSIHVTGYEELLEEALSDPLFAFQEAPYAALAREWGKWRALQTTIEDMLNDTDSYLIRRNVTPEGLDSLQHAVNTRMDVVVAAAKACLADTSTCAGFETVSDLQALLKLPMPTSHAYPEAAFMEADRFRKAVADRWVRPANVVRCAQPTPSHEHYCLENGDIRAATAALPLDGSQLFYPIRLGRHDAPTCLTMASDASARLMAFQCPGDDVPGPTQQFTYDPETRLVRVRATIQPKWKAAWTWRSFADTQTVCLNTKSADKADGTHVIGWPCEQSANMRYDFLPIDDATTLIRDLNSGKCLAVSGDDDPPQIELAGCDRHASAQAWAFGGPIVASVPSKTASRPH